MASGEPASGKEFLRARDPEAPVHLMRTELYFFPKASATSFQMRERYLLPNARALLLSKGPSVTFFRKHERYFFPKARALLLSKGPNLGHQCSYLFVGQLSFKGRHEFALAVMYYVGDLLISNRALEMGVGEVWLSFGPPLREAFSILTVAQSAFLTK